MGALEWIRDIKENLSYACNAMLRAMLQKSQQFMENLENFDKQQFLKD